MMKSRSRIYRTAVILLAVVVAVAAASCRRADDSTPFGHSYRVSEISYASLIYSFSFTLETAPLYAISADGELLATLGDEPAESRGIFTETEISADSFDALFLFDTDFDAAKLRQKTVAAWRLTVEDDPNAVFYYLLKQDDGSVYLAYGYDGAEYDPSIRWLFRLEADD